MDTNQHAADAFVIAGRTYRSRLLTGTGKYRDLDAIAGVESSCLPCRARNDFAIDRNRDAPRGLIQRRHEVGDSRVASDATLLAVECNVNGHVDTPALGRRQRIATVGVV